MPVLMLQSHPLSTCRSFSHALRFPFLLQFVDKFNEAKAAAKELANERQQAAKRQQDQEKTLPPAVAVGGSSPSPTSPHIKSPSLISPPASTGSMTSKSPSPLQSSPGPETIETSEHSSNSSTSSKEGVMDGLEVRGEQAERKLSASSGGSSPLVNGGESPHMELHLSHRVTTNGHSSEVCAKGRGERESKCSLINISQTVSVRY